MSKFSDLLPESKAHCGNAGRKSQAHMVSDNKKGHTIRAEAHPNISKSCSRMVTITQLLGEGPDPRYRVII